MTEKTMTDIRMLQNMMARTNSVKEKTALSDAIVLFSRQEPKGKAYTGRCAGCGKPIWIGARYCPKCGCRQPAIDDQEF